jgi:CHASE1-domain containing sensor protein
MMAIREGTAARQARFNNMRKPFTVLSLLFIAALTMGVAVAQRMEQRAQQDRFSFGHATEYVTQ